MNDETRIIMNTSEEIMKCSRLPPRNIVKISTLHHFKVCMLCALPGTFREDSTNKCTVVKQLSRSVLHDATVLWKRA
ncbi:unnamed protein product [Acanthoscelides obtectus]|uniref:Uncharacterized protein n=1 Tax=Acanthoscelides obtectus TaxID=200917 RepID=A0A9P0JHI4_ACAOB|nr:unnamed protein product [Acanthoscelides obtectus]CAK1678731.1 hypothetical protein AOBTE_LOCUS32013 [Acanthoscelides obtectus]